MQAAKRIIKQLLNKKELQPKLFNQEYSLKTEQMKNRERKDKPSTN